MLWALLVSIVSLALTVAVIVCTALVVKSAVQRTWRGDRISVADLGRDAKRDTESIFRKVVPKTTSCRDGTRDMNERVTKEEEGTSTGAVMVNKPSV